MTETSPAWHALDPDEAVQRLESDREGLSREEATRRLEEYGPNRLDSSKGPGALVRFLRQFHDILIYILIVAALVTAVIGEWIDTGVILAVVAINALIGFIQEGKAERALEAIGRRLSTEARVLRDGERGTIPAEELVPGDVVVLKAGDKVAADLRLFAARELRIDEALLTGESAPAEKGTDATHAEAGVGDRTGMAFSGTLVTSGYGSGVVAATGGATELGRISELVQETPEITTPLIRQITSFGRTLAVAIVVFATLTFVYGFFIQGQPAVGIFTAAVALAVAAIPEGLPALLTITLALGVRRMAERNAIIRRLPAVDTLGAITVICSDKTGTLTRGEMTVRTVVTSERRFRTEGIGYAPEGGFRVATRSGESGPRRNRTTAAGDAEESEGHEYGQSVEDGGGAHDSADPGEEAPLSLGEQPVLEELLRGAVLCNDSELIRASQEEGAAEENGPPAEGDANPDDEPVEEWRVSGDPMEGALIAAAMKAGLVPAEERRAWERIDAIPFESKNRFMATLHHAPDGAERVTFVKGAPEQLLEMCDRERREDGVEPLDRDRWQERADTMAAGGERVLALAVRHGDRDDAGDRLDPEGVREGLVLLGLVGIVDPPREAALEAIRRARRAGIRVKMVTGDHALTAGAIAEELGIGRASEPDPGGGSAVTGRQIAELEPDALATLALDRDVFARVDPEHKLRLVQAIQGRHQVVAMTGDGVNDAPALKRADVGIAMGIKGTEAAREASEMVLTDDNFASIIHAVEEGRTVYDNLRKAILFILPTNGGEALTILLAIVLGRVLPLTPVQLLWVNMITAVTLGLALAFEPGEKGVMRRPPRSPDRKLLDGFFLWRIAFVSTVMASGTFGLFLWMRADGTSVAVARTIAVNTLVVFQIFYLLSARRIRESVLSFEGLFGSRHVLGAIATVIFFQLLFTYLPWMQLLFGTAPLDAGHWGMITGVGASLFVLVESEKWIIRRFGKGTKEGTKETAG